MVKTLKTLIGLDIDEKSIKVVELRRTGAGITLTNYAIVEIPPHEDVEKVSSIVDTIKKTFAEHHIEGTEVYTALSGPSVSIRRIIIPVMPKEELFGAVRWEAKNLIPFPIDTVVLDYYVIGKVVTNGVEKLDIIVVAVQKETLKEHLRILDLAGLKPLGVTVNPFALWEVVKADIPSKPQEVVTLIDIGAEAASINLFKEGVLQFTREISVAGDSITRAMTGVFVSDQWQLSLTYEQAEKIKRIYGIPKEGTADKTEDGIPLSQILEVIKPTLRRLLNEILRSFDYYKEQFREAKIDKVVLSGGSSKLKNLEEFLSGGLGIKVEIVNPLSHLVIDPKIDSVKLLDVAPRLTLSIGLAIGESKGLNLIQVKKEEKKAIEFGKILEAVKIPYPALVSGVILILVIIMSINIYLGRRIKYLKERLKSREAILSDLRVLSERRATLEQISKEETRLREVLSKFTQTIGGGISLTSLSYNNSTRQIVITGEGGRTSQVGRFLRNIENSPHFSRANLIETKKILVDDVPKMSFKISFHVD